MKSKKFEKCSLLTTKFPAFFPSTQSHSGPVSSELSDLCEISDLLLFFSHFASQNKEITSGNAFVEVCCVN